MYQSKKKKKERKKRKTTESQNPFLSCLSEEEHWCKELVRSYKPHKLHYLTSTRLLFTQNGPWLKQKLEGSMETMGREDENDEEGKEKERNYRRWWKKREKTNREIKKRFFIFEFRFFKDSKTNGLLASFHCLLTLRLRFLVNCQTHFTSVFLFVCV